MKFLRRLNPFPRKPTPTSRELEILADAQMMLVECTALAEHYQSQAAMYQRRINRIEGQQAADDHAEFHYHHAPQEQIK